MPAETNQKKYPSFQLSLEAQLEALLFVAPGPVGVSQLAEALEVSNKEVERCLQDLERYYQERGVRLQTHNDKICITTAPETAELVERFLDLEATTRLSRAALETLAIIAYLQPVTRPSIDAIRGVNSDGVLRTLLSRGLIEEAGRAEGLGRPILYTTTSQFLQYFGLTTLKEMPPLAVAQENQEGQPDPSNPTQMQPKLLKD